MSRKISVQERGGSRAGNNISNKGEGGGGKDWRSGTHGSQTNGRRYGNNGY